MAQRSNKAITLIDVDRLPTEDRWCKCLISTVLGKQQAKMPELSAIANLELCLGSFQREDSGVGVSG
jgi:hypothetical protein